MITQTKYIVQSQPTDPLPQNVGKWYDDWVYNEDELQQAIDHRVEILKEEPTKWKSRIMKITITEQIL